MKCLLLLLLVAPYAVLAQTTTTTVAYASKDACIFENNPTYSNGAGPAFFSGTNGDPSPRRALISFNLSGIPSNATITSVQLTLTLALVAGSAQGNVNPNPANIGLYALTRDWGEGNTYAGVSMVMVTGQGQPANTGDSTWNDAAYSLTSWTTVGGDYNPSLRATLSIPSNTAVGTPCVWASTSALVSDVQGWLNHPTSNFGWILVNADEKSFRTLDGFYSREWGTVTGGDPTEVPMLQITYTLPTQVSVPANVRWGTGAALFIVSLLALRRRAFIAE